MIAVLVMFLVFGCFAGFMVLIVVWSMHANKTRREAWARVAERLGLAYVSDTISGQLDGQEVKAWVKVVGGGRNRSYYTVVSGLLQPGVDLGLSIYKEGFLSKAALGLFGHVDVSTGDPSFDPLYVVRADEPARAVALLSPELRGALIELHRSGNAFSLSDAGCEVECSGITSDERWLESCMRSAAHLSGVMNRARRQLPSASALLAYGHAWKQFARQTGWRGMDTPLSMWGRLDRDQVHLYAVRIAPHDYRIEALVRFDQPLQAGLHVRRPQALEGIATFFGGQDVEVGHPAFDAAFVVKAARVDVARAALDAEVCNRLVDLAHRVGPVQVRDDGVVLQSATMAHDPRHAFYLVDQARVVASRIADNLRRPVLHAGPYR